MYMYRTTNTNKKQPRREGESACKTRGMERWGNTRLAGLSGREMRNTRLSAG